MPLLIINSLAPADPAAISRLLVDVRDAGARALDCPPDNIWVMFQPVAPGHYLQGAEAAATLQPASHPPVVLVRAQSGRTPAQREGFMAAVTGAVGRGLGVPAANVWGHYQEMSPHDVWFEGRWCAQLVR